MANSIKYKWYKVKVLTKKWNDYYSKIGSYTFLGEEDKDTWIGFLAVVPPENCLEITNIEELRKIQLHKEASNSYPRPFDELK